MPKSCSFRASMPMRTPHMILGGAGQEGWERQEGHDQAGRAGRPGGAGSWRLAVNPWVIQPVFPAGTAANARVDAGLASPPLADRYPGATAPELRRRDRFSYPSCSSLHRPALPASRAPPARITSHGRRTACTSGGGEPAQDSASGKRRDDCGGGQRGWLPARWQRSGLGCERFRPPE
jgi:hypothetical protein